MHAFNNTLLQYLLRMACLLEQFRAQQPEGTEIRVRLRALEAEKGLEMLWVEKG